MKQHRKASPEVRFRLAVNLKRLREAKVYTQAELGRRVGLTKNYVSSIEQERVNISLANLEPYRTHWNVSRSTYCGP